jgi:hypothetical protein
MPTSSKTKAPKKTPKSKSTAGTGKGQGEVGEIRHDLAHWLTGEGPIGGYRAAQAQQGGSGLDIAASKIEKPVEQAVEAAGGIKKPPTKKKPKPPKPPTTTSAAATAPANPFEQLAQGLVSQLQAEQAPVEQAVSGADTAPATSNAVNQALADAGLSPGSSAGQWLNANVAQANQNDQPMAQAMQAYGQAYTQGQGKVDTALTQLGQSSDVGIQTAPEQTWLTDLASHIQSNLANYGQIPSGAAETLPPAILYYLQQSGTGGLGGGTGVKQLSQIAVPGEHTAASAVPSISSAAPGSTITPSLTDTAGAAPS